MMLGLAQLLLMACTWPEWVYYAQMGYAGTESLVRTSQPVKQTTKRQSDRYLTVFGQIPDPAIILDKENRSEQLNDAASEMLAGEEAPSAYTSKIMRKEGSFIQFARLKESMSEFLNPK